MLYMLEIYRKNDNVEQSKKELIQKIIIEKILLILNAIVITVGFLIYLGEQEGNFEIMPFIFGKPECKDTIKSSLK